MDVKTRFESIVEKRIREAMEQGKFDNLPGHGKPLALDDDDHVPDDLKLAHKILKNAGCIPKEIEINYEIRRMEDLISGMNDVSDKYRAMKKLAVLKQKMLMNKSSAALHIPEHYEQNLVERLEKKS
ncbi:MAG: DUF1992 domain-containing protein [Proteobacteria bacterium]|nr:DUF1992 domain-containing protein [Pseudomonadota bacterium]